MSNGPKPLDPPLVDPQAVLKRRLKLWTSTLEAARKFMDDPTQDRALVLRAEAFIWLDNLGVWTTVSDVDTGNPLLPDGLSLPLTDLVDSTGWLLIGWTYDATLKWIERSRIDLKDAPAWVINRAEKDIRTCGTREAIDLLVAAAIDQAMYNPHGLKYSLAQLEVLDRMKAADLILTLQRQTCTFLGKTYA